MKTKLTKLIEEREKYFNTQYSTVDWSGYPAKSEVRRFNRQTSIALLEKILERIEVKKADTVKETGSYKYNFVYDEIAEELQKSLNKLKEEKWKKKILKELKVKYENHIKTPTNR